MEEGITQPTSRELSKSELASERMFRSMNRSHNEIYIVAAKTASDVMKETGRLREVAFRLVGGDIGESMDVDEFDTTGNCYRRLIVWNPGAEEITGGYRCIFGSEWEIDKNGQPKVVTSHMFHFSDKFMKEYAPHTVELGRSFVPLDYQSVRKNSESIFALDNLWGGFGALAMLYPECKYSFGKITMYSSYIRRGRDMIPYFLKKYFDGKDNLIMPTKPLKIDTPTTELDALFQGNGLKEDYRTLNREIYELGYNIPPLVNVYTDFFPVIKLFGIAINYGFGDVEETGILITVNKIFEKRRVRRTESFVGEHPEAFRFTSGASNVIYKKKKQQ